MAFNTSNIVINDSKLPTNGMHKHVFVNHITSDKNNQSSQNISFTLSQVKIPFGIKYFTSNDGDVKASVVLSLDPNQKEFITQLKCIEHHIKTEAQSRSKQWFGHECDVNEITNMFRESLYHKNKSYPPSITVKVPSNTTVCDESKNVIKLSSIKPMGYINITFEISGIWISGDKFGINWRAKLIESLKYKDSKKQVQNNMKSYAFNDDE